MDKEQFLKNLSTPTGTIDVVLDTDAYNEIDDQFAIGYLLCSAKKLNVKGICAAPFFNDRSVSAEDGMEKSYDEILRLLSLTKRDALSCCVYKGSGAYLQDEHTPIESDAANFMAELSEHYSPEHPLYIVAIGAITNVASAILKNPSMKENCVVVWLGGHSLHIEQPVLEFNMRQDIAAARVVFGCGIPLIQLPCGGVVDRFLTSKYELAHWLKGKNALCDYLYESTVSEAEKNSPFQAWTRIIWDVTAVGFLLNDTNKPYMKGRFIPSPIPEYDGSYTFDEKRHLIHYIEWINRDALFEDLFQNLRDSF